MLHLLSRGALQGLLAAAVATPSLAAQAADLSIRPERTAFEETSRYDDVVAFAEAVAAASDRIHLTRFGYSFEGRALPLLVVGAVAGPDPATVLATGKTRVFVQANIHGGEVCGKEAMLLLLRDLAGGAHRQWDDSLVLLVAPLYNADGNERILLTNRGRQHGPLAGMGQRPNAQGYDLNRDHMKLDSPEARALVRLMQRYDPHVTIDLHTTNGSFHAYHLTYAPPLHPNTAAPIDRLLREEWLPAADAHLAAETGWESHYYGNVARPPRVPEAGWYTFDHRPRFNNNYAGLRNRFAILSEAYSYAPFEERVVATLRFVEGAVAFAFANASRIREITASVDGMSLVGTRLGLRAAPERSAPAEILMGEVERVRNPYSGASLLLRRDVVHAERMAEYGTFAATETERVPAAYLIPGDHEAVLDKLADHGIRTSALERETVLAVEEFVVDSTTAADREFQGHRERTVFGRYVQGTRTLPQGTVVISTNQPLGRLAFSLLEPRSDDGLANWNVMDEWLGREGTYPVLRTFDWR